MRIDSKIYDVKLDIVWHPLMWTSLCVQDFFLAWFHMNIIPYLRVPFIYVSNKFSLC